MSSSNRELVVLLCDDYDDAEEAYYIFKEWLEFHESWTIVRCYDKYYGITTNDGFAYVFIDARMVNVFVDMTDDIIYVQEFFDEIMTDTYEREVFKSWKRGERRSRRYVLA